MSKTPSSSSFSMVLGGLRHTVAEFISSVICFIIIQTFTWSKSFIPIGDPRRRRTRRSSSFTTKWPLLDRTHIDGGGRTTGDFLSTLLKNVTNLLPIVTRVSHVRGISDKIISPAITSFIGHKFGTHFGRVKKSCLCGLFGTNRSPLMSGGPASHRHPFLSNTCFVSCTLANPLSINFGIISKLGGRSVGLLVSCTSFARYGPGMIII